MDLNNTHLYLTQNTLLLDQVGADGVTLLCVILSALLKANVPVCLVSATETLHKFNLLLRKLYAPDLLFLEAEKKFKFDRNLEGSIDAKYFVIVHGANFFDVKDVCEMTTRPNTLFHIHKEIDEKMVRYVVGRSNLVIEASPLPSGFSNQIFCRLAVYSGGLYHPVVKSTHALTVSASDNHVTLAEA
jgi:hypothetical protein